MKSLLFVAMSVPIALFGGVFDKAVLHGETAKNPLNYKANDPIVFTLKIQGADDFKKGEYYVAWKRTGDDGKKEEGKFDATEKFTYTTSMDCPGYVRLEGYLRDAKGKEIKKQYRGDTTTPEGQKALNAFEKSERRVFFQGGALVDAEKIDTVPEPADFDAFWAKRRARLAQIPIEADLKPAKKPIKGFRTYAVYVKCPGPRPATGYVTIPEKPGKYPIKVSYHGYGHTFPNKGAQIHPWANKDAISFYFTPHGYDLDREPEYYDEFWRSICSGGTTFLFDNAINKDPDNSYFCGYTYRLIRALEWLKTLEEWNHKDLIVQGGSMGGMQSVWAASLDPDVSEAYPFIPWNCDMGGRETNKRICSSWRIHETPALRYYDPVNLAKRIKPTCKVTITRAGLGDDCCPPSGVMLLWNRLNCQKKINWVQGSNHGYVPREANAQTFVVEKNGK